MHAKILALYGSPRRGGNTDILMEEFLAGISRDGGVDITKLYLSELNIQPCNGCGFCETTGICNINDDMQEIYPLLEDSHIIAVSSPVYFFGVSAQCKAMIDRTHVFWARKFVLNQPWSRDDEMIRQGFLISAAGTYNPALFQGLELTVQFFFECMDIVYRGSIMVPGVQEYAEVKEKLQTLKDAYNKGVELMNPAQ